MILVFHVAVLMTNEIPDYTHVVYKEILEPLISAKECCIKLFVIFHGITAILLATILSLS